MTDTLRGWDPHRRRRVEVRWDRTGLITDVSELDAGDRDGDRDGDGDGVISKGLIDLQVNGFRGQDLNADDVSPDTVSAITEELSRVGVTTWVPTIVTNTEAFIQHALEQVASASAADPRVAAAIPFVHVEGPFISDQEGARGVHDPALVRPIDADEVARWVDRHPVVGIVTVSPHTDDAPAQIRRIRDLGIAVSLGHTHASTAQLRAAVDAGATLATHLGNGIPALLPRHPNAIWTLLADDRVTAGIIADGHHLPDDVITVMLRAKTVDGMFLVSDATALAGRPPGRYTTPVGGEVEVSADGRLSYVGTDLLAGAGRHLADGVRHLVSGVGVSWADALRLAVGTPARVLGLDHAHTAGLEPGCRADLVLFRPEGDVDSVVVGGTVVQAT